MTNCDRNYNHHMELYLELPILPATDLRHGCIICRPQNIDELI